MKQKNHTVIELIVKNHPGVMSHITGLFSRRGYNLEGILCGAIGEGSSSVMYLLVRMNDQYQQVIRQLEKLHDVIEVKERHEYDHTVFYKVDNLFNNNH
ncbi:MAG: ACT domain-containing protein [Bacteroidales bacterium]|nr:ACT domain-containing protein [Bacteroidales bacterium]